MSMLNEWIQALESGDYVPCTGAYRSDDRFCTVGVLMNVYAPEEWQTSDGSTCWYYPLAGSTVIKETVPEMIDYSVVCREQTEWGEEYRREDLQHTIQDLNDIYGSYDKPLDMLKALRNGWSLSVGEELITTHEMVME